MSLIQIRVRCEKKFRECAGKCFGCQEAQIMEIKALSGRPSVDQGRVILSHNPRRVDQQGRLGQRIHAESSTHTK